MRGIGLVMLGAVAGGLIVAIALLHFGQPTEITSTVLASTAQPAPAKHAPMPSPDPVFDAGIAPIAVDTGVRAPSGEVDEPRRAPRRRPIARPVAVAREVRAPAVVQERAPPPAAKQESDAERIGREEARRVLEFVREIQSVSDDALGGRVDQLRAIAATQPDVIGVRDHCADVFANLSDGVERHEHVARDILERERRTSSHEALAALHEELARAETTAEQARKQIPSCVQGLRDLARRYHF
jgi:hypothetical protein